MVFMGYSEGIIKLQSDGICLVYPGRAGECKAIAGSPSQAGKPLRFRGCSAEPGDDSQPIEENEIFSIYSLFMKEYAGSQSELNRIRLGI